MDRSAMWVRNRLRHANKLLRRHVFTRAAKQASRSTRNHAAGGQVGTKGIQNRWTRHADEMMSYAVPSDTPAPPAPSVSGSQTLAVTDTRQC